MRRPHATRYGVSPWLHGFPKSRQPNHPRHRGHLDIDVAIVGGGLTGCATAYAFAAAGVKVALFEQDRIGQGSTAFTGGTIAADPGLDFAVLEKLHGRRAARHLWQAWRRAALDAVATLRRLRVPCRLVPRDELWIAARDAAQEKRVRRDWQARRAAGVEASLVQGMALTREVATSASVAIRTRGHAQVDPYRACLGLASAAAKRGTQIFERSPVGRIRFGRRDVSLQTDGGTVTAGRVIVATGLPTPEFKSLRRHVRPVDTYLVMTGPVPAAVRKSAGRPSTMLRDSHEPAHYLRWEDENRRIVFAGAGQDAVPARLIEKTLVQRTGQLMYELSLLYPAISGLQADYGWSVTGGQTADGLPYIGPHRNYPHHLFAFGQAGHGIAGSFLASRLLLREHLGTPSKADELFAFTRSTS
ncbi:MAG TPA: FAD-binding oxidoreductase [Vicinamibacterales bacterium]|nr:FAD-binding oxidoreductase [Vicinamibacterales bacterium]